MNYAIAVSGLLISLVSLASVASELKVGKACPIKYQQASIGQLIFSKEWYHSSRSDARYIPGDNATGIGIEIHLQNNYSGLVQGLNLAQCDRYRILQIRQSNARLLAGEHHLQVDVPDNFDNPFYDNAPLEHGYGLHRTPEDDSDKPWQGQPLRHSSVSIYDTPYVSDAYGIEGKNIEVSFETCAVCERDRGYDSVLACGLWGYSREYIGGHTGWTEPEFDGVDCTKKPSELFCQALESSSQIDYSYWVNWR